MPPDLYQKLLEYINKKRIKANAQIFSLTRSAIWQVFKKRGITPHDLRLYHLETKSLWMSFYIEPISVFVEHTTIGTTTARYTRT
ncbi:MAG: hypothetical protein FJ242_10655 [Nitrospira sp.]|nr:hypothetical protein [Nitrospira sp.]